MRNTHTSFAHLLPQSRSFNLSRIVNGVHKRNQRERVKFSRITRMPGLAAYTHWTKQQSNEKKGEKRERGKRKNKKIRELNSRANKFRLVERCNDKQRCSGASAKPEKSLFPRYGGWVEWSLSARLLYARNSSRYSITILLTMISHSGPSRAPSSVNEPAVTPRDNSILRRSQRAFGGGTAPNRHE